jgi:hypothetical protein
MNCKCYYDRVLIWGTCFVYICCLLDQMDPWASVNNSMPCKSDPKSWNLTAQPASFIQDGDNRTT